VKILCIFKLKKWLKKIKSKDEEHGKFHPHNFQATWIIQILVIPTKKQEARKLGVFGRWFFQSIFLKKLFIYLLNIFLVF
jgi:hypothetical protein